MPYPELKAILTDIGTEELSHLEMVGTIVYQLTRNLTPQQIKEAGFDTVLCGSYDRSLSCSVRRSFQCRHVRRNRRYHCRYPE